MTIMVRRSMRILLFVGSWSLFSVPAFAQLDNVFSNLFYDILGPGRLSLSPGKHANHFKPAADNANAELVPALNSLIVGDISSFPLSSASGGISYDFSSGRPVRTTESLGPIFAETARPIGKGKLQVEANFTYLDLTRFRGLPSDQIDFTFTHQLVPGDMELGDNPNESDIIDVVMDLHTRISISAVVASWGVTDDLDASIAIPVTSVHINGTAVATIHSYTFAEGGAAHHFFGGDSLHPVLVANFPYDRSATGLGDVALRVKYSLARGGSMDAAGLLDVRFPTGEKENFLGTGKPSYRLWGILSTQMGNGGVHLNAGYTRNPADLQSDAFEFRAGFDNKISQKVTFALDALGKIDLNKSEAAHLAPGTATIIDRIENTRDNPGGGLVPDISSVRVVKLSNIPDRNNDNAYSAAIGFRYAPSDDVVIFANVLVPLNDGGLRAQMAPTVGVSAAL